jgi:hypothetical protein
MTVSSVYSIGGRIDVYAARNFSGTYNPMRIVSFDNGDSWVGNWTQVRPPIQGNNLEGAFTTMIAGAITGDSLDTVLVGRESDNRFSSTVLQEYFLPPTADWTPIGSGTFYSKPAVCLSGASQTTPLMLGPNKQTTSYSGVNVAVFGRGTDDHMWWAYSTDGANTWDMAWQPIGEGVFNSSPAAACSAAGELLAVFGVGTDQHMYWAYSTSSGSSWDSAWAAPIGEGVFTSEPAAACSADGSRIYVFGRGTDNRCYWAYTARGTQGWDMAWQPIGEGVFNSSPAASCSWDGQMVQVFARGTDNRIYQARSQDFGNSWDIAWRPISDQQFIDVGV